MQVKYTQMSDSWWHDLGELTRELEEPMVGKISRIQPLGRNGTKKVLVLLWIFFLWIRLKIEQD